MNIGKESEVLEYKKSTSERFEAVDDIVAILNKHGKGTLYFGIKPNGDVVGQEIVDSTLNDIAVAIKDSIKPMIYPEIKEEVLDGKKVIKVTFKGMERPYSSKGKYYKRVFDRSEEMTPVELKNVMASTDYSSIWENNLTKFTIADINKESLKRYYNKAISSGRLDPLDKYDEEELLTGLGLMENRYLTNAGYYLFSNKKPIVLKIAVYVTDEKISFSDIKRYENNIIELIDIAYAYIKEKMNWRVEFNGGISRVEIPEVPIEAIREIIVNSFAHANYRGITEHEIDITPTKIEIYNPGDFPTNLNPLMFIKEKRKSMPRNKVILNTLFKSKDVEMFGSGFKKVYSLCNENNVRTEFDNNEEGFTFIFFRDNEKTSNVINDENLTLSLLEKNVLKIVKEKPKSTREEIANNVNKTPRTIQRIINNLVEKGYIKRVGSNKTGYWEICE